ncbi:hypothetical protein ACFWAZ_36620 [Streptomyces collinus]|uniref:hypothetical protein n=1 Tax=Streptomyces collinus TaxID=42684 RepID=UPI00364992FE
MALDRRQTADRAVAEAVRSGDAPAVVARTIATAATAPKPRPRCPAGPLAGRACVLRRLAPADQLETLLGCPPKTVRWALENHPRIRRLAAA